MSDLRQNLRQALRSLARRPAFVAVVVLTLALGIGANSAIFSVINAVLLKPLPYREPDRLALIWSRWTNFRQDLALPRRVPRLPRHDPAVRGRGVVGQ